VDAERVWLIDRTSIDGPDDRLIPTLVTHNFLSPALRSSSIAIFGAETHGQYLA
jgi:hypothetical protein